MQDARGAILPTQPGRPLEHIGRAAQRREGSSRVVLEPAARSSRGFEDETDTDAAISGGGELVDKVVLTKCPVADEGDPLTSAADELK